MKLYILAVNRRIIIGSFRHCNGKHNGIPCLHTGQILLKAIQPVTGAKLYIILSASGIHLLSVHISLKGSTDRLSCLRCSCKLLIGCIFFPYIVDLVLQILIRHFKRNLHALIFTDRHILYRIIIQLVSDRFMLLPPEDSSCSHCHDSKPCHCHDHFLLFLCRSHLSCSFPAVCLFVFTHNNPFCLVIFFLI